MGSTADDIREQVDANRSSAEDKINKIEQQVTGQAQALQEKVSGAGEMIQEKVADTAQQVKEQFDWRKQVNDRPLVAVGAAMIGGMLLGKMTGSGGGGGHHAPDVPHNGAGMMAGGGMIAGALQNAMQKSGLSDQLETTMHDLFSTVTSRMKEMTKDMPGMSSGGSQSDSGSSASGSGSSGSGSSSSGSSGSGSSGSSSSSSMGDLSRTYGSTPERSTSAV